MSGLNYRQELTKKKPEKSLISILSKKSGRNNQGKISVRHQGGRNKRFLRAIDWKRDKIGIPGKVVAIEYDPNRTANIALIHYIDGEKRYIIAPRDLKIGETIISQDDAEIKIGNAMKLKNIPIGVQFHAVELIPGRGAKIVRAAGAAATILAKEDKYVTIKLPSGEIRKILNECRAVIGQVTNEDWNKVIIGKAGRARHMGKRPQVRGVAQDPRSHPHGGGEGRSGIGLKKGPKTPWGRPAFQKTRKANKWSDRFIIKRRK